MISLVSKISAALALALYAIIAVTTAVNAQTVADKPQKASSGAFMFSAADLDGQNHALDSYLADGKFVILEWFNPDCPYVKKYHAPGTSNKSRDEALAYARENDVIWLMINSNARGKQGSGAERNNKAIKDYGIDVPVMLDPTGEIGQAYGATSTPQMFLISPEGKVLYNGGIDDTKLDTDVPGVNYVIDAIAQAQAGQPVDPAATPHPGCSVKYPDEV